MEEAVIEKSVFEEIPTEKIYTEKAITVGTFLGGPLVAGYFMAENFKVFGDFDKARKTWIITILATLFIFGLIFLIPENINIPNMIFPIIYMGIAAYFTKKYQEKQINTHIENGGEHYNWWRTLLISIIGISVLLGAVFSISFLTEAANGRLAESTKKYGTMNHEIAYQSNINENEVDKIAVAFEKTFFFDDAITKYVYLEKIDNNYEISISCNESVKDDAIAAQPFVQLRDDMQKYFPHNKIILKLVVDNLDNVVKRIE
jgi:L-lactate permease